MPRLQMIEQRDQASPDQVIAFDQIVASRGKMLRPFSVMLHRPEIARAAADLGAVIRYQGVLGDADRELAIAATAVERSCQFEWDSHSPLAEAAGVSSVTLEQVSAGEQVTDPIDAELVDFVRELCRTGVVSNQTFDLMRNRLSVPGVVELVTTIGYYSMIALVLSASDAC